MKYAATVIIFFIVQHLHSQDTMHYSKPVFTSVAVNRVKINSDYYYQLTAIDSANRPLSFSVKHLPAWLKFDSIHHIISGETNKTGQVAIHIEVTNNHSVAKQNFMLTVFDNNTMNILCLGNSLTNGTNKFNSYRRDLWLMLHNNNYNFDFIGSWNRHHAGGEMPNDDFDTDHDGHSGWTIDNMFHPPAWDSARGNIAQWLAGYKPGIVLIELGTNDVFQCVKVTDMILKLNLLVQTLRNNNPSVNVFIAQIPPLGKQWAPKKLCGDSVPYSAVIIDLNKQIEIFAFKTNTKSSPVHAVDQFTGVDPATGMYDDIHPNADGEKIMAKRWFDAIKIYLKKLP